MKKSLKSAAFAAALVFLGSFLFVSCDNTVGGTGNTSISAPTLNSATYSSSTNKVTLSWSEVSGADYYIISEAYGSGSYVELDGEMTGSSCAITDFTKSGTFYY